jgi:hypothetical protein
MEAYRAPTGLCSTTPALPCARGAPHGARAWPGCLGWGYRAVVQADQRNSLRGGRNDRLVQYQDHGALAPCKTALEPPLAWRPGGAWRAKA